MHKEDCFYLCIVARKHSFKGEVVIVLDTDEPYRYENMESVFIAFGNNLIPFFIKKSLLQKGKQLRVTFEDINNETDANGLLNAEVYLPLKFLPKLTGTQFYFHEVIGFQVIDKQFGAIGILENINDSGAQALLEIKHEAVTILIPLVDNFIKKIDRKNKILHIEAPNGLIDLYLH
jgi:16S rRNA processing protein RimM